MKSDILEPGRAASRSVADHVSVWALEMVHWDTVYPFRKRSIIQPNVWVDLDGDALAESSLDGADDLVDPGPVLPRHFPHIVYQRIPVGPQRGEDDGASLVRRFGIQVRRQLVDDAGYRPLAGNWVNYPLPASG